jgi:hypothetical protein
MWPHLSQTLVDFTRDVPPGILAVAAALFLIGVLGAVRQKDWPVLLLLPSVLLASAIVLFTKRRIPFARTWIFIIPLFIVVLDSGFAWVMSKVSAGMRSVLQTAVTGTAGFLVVSLVSTNAIEAYEDTGTFAEAETVVEYLMPILSRGDPVYALCPADWPVYYYLWYHKVPQAEAGAEKPESRREYFVVKKGAYSLAELTDASCDVLLDVGDLTLYQATEADAD